MVQRRHATAFWHLFAPALFAGLFLAAACNRPSKPVARVGDTWIGQDRWVAFLKAANMDAKAPKPQKEQVLKSLIRRTVACEMAAKKGLEKQVLSKERHGLIAEQITVYQVLQDRVAKQPTFTEAEIKKYYDDRTAQRHLRHVLCAKEADAQACVADLKAAKPFKETLSKYCTEQGVLKSEGDLGLRTHGSVPPKFADAIFEAADGAVLGPFQVDNGWEVVVVVERQAPAESTFALQKDKVLAQMNRERADRLRRELIEESQKKYGLKIRQENLPAVLDPKILPADEKTVVAEVGTEPVTLAEIKRFVVTLTQRSGSAPSLLKADLAKYLQMMAGEKAVLAVANKEGVGRRADVKAKIWNAEQDELAAAYGQTWVKEMPVAPEALKAFYDENKQKFRALNEVVVRTYSCDKEDNLRKAVEEIRGKSPLAQVQKKYGVEVANGGKATPFDYQKPPVQLPPQTLRAIGSAREGSWLGTFPSGRGFMAIEVASVKPGKEVTFEEAGDQVRIAYLSQNGMSLLEAFLDGEAQLGLKVESFPKNI